MPKARNFFGRSLISRQTAEDVYYYLFNGHGDVVQLTNEQGDILKDYRYDPFGRELDDQLPLMPGKPSVSLWRSEVEKLDNPFQYAGEYLDQETGLYYLRARYYDPQIQRFIFEDSFAKSPYWQQHVYAYCGYNPVNFIDPSGYAYVWNRFGEVIGTTDGSSYTDYSQKATNTHGGTPEIVNRPWDGDSDAPEIGNLINNYYNEAINEVVKGNATWEDLSIVSKTISYSGVKDDLIRAKAGNYYNGEIISDISSGVDLIPGKQLAYAQIIMRGSIFLKNIYNSLVNKVAGKAAPKIENLANDMKSWLGDGARLVKNKSGDTVIISKDGTRRIRFDINNPAPHNSPHGHIEELVNGKWVKSGPIYPKDVPHN